MELLASQVVADREVVPSEESTALTWAASEPVGLEPMDPAPSVPSMPFYSGPNLYGPPDMR